MDNREDNFNTLPRRGDKSSSPADIRVTFVSNICINLIASNSNMWSGRSMRKFVNGIKSWVKPRAKLLLPVLFERGRDWKRYNPSCPGNDICLYPREASLRPYPFECFAMSAGSETRNSTWFPTQPTDHSSSLFKIRPSLCARSPTPPYLRYP